MTRVQLRPIRIGNPRLALGLAIAGLALLFALPADSAETQKIRATRAQLDAACDASSGIAWGTVAKGGRYGCITDAGWIECDSQGNCEGGRAVRRH